MDNKPWRPVKQVYNLVYSGRMATMQNLQSIGTYEAKTHLADLLRQVRAGQGFTITQRGDPVADLVPAGTSAHRAGAQAANRMRQFMLDAPKMGAFDIRALMDEGRD